MTERRRSPGTATRAPSQHSDLTVTATHDSAPSQRPDLDALGVARDLDAILEWLDALVVLGGPDPLPVLGSRAWLAADTTVKLASAARYLQAVVAEDEPSVVAARLAAELALARREHAAAMVAASHAVSAAGAPWTGVDRVDHAELVRRRGVPGRLAGGAR